MPTFEMSSSEGKQAKANSENLTSRFYSSNLSWQSNMGNVSIRNVKFRGDKDKQQKFEVQLSKFQGFKVSNLRWQSNMGNINIRNVSIQNTKCRMQGQTAKIWGFSVTLRSKLCYNILIYFINLSNLWQLAAHWDSWNVLCCFGKVWSVWHWQIYVDLILNCGSIHGSLYRW